eukprot:5526808-Heterocapsa_arctica.AAC.1
MVSGGLALTAESTVEYDTPIYAHCPVELKVRGKLSEDMGQILRRPIDHKGRGQTISSVTNTISAFQDNSDGFAITADMRHQQLT